MEQKLEVSRGPKKHFQFALTELTLLREGQRVTNTQSRLGPRVVMDAIRKKKEVAADDGVGQMGLEEGAIRK